MLSAGSALIRGKSGKLGIDQSLKLRFGAEIEQQPYLQLGRLQEIDDLGLMSRDQGANRLQLDQHAFLNNKIGNEMTDTAISKVDWR